MDCDPGLDDAIALLFAIASPDEIDLLGITTVVGNCPLDQTEKNARRVCELAGRPDLKVFKGCSRTFFAKLTSADYDYTGSIHGETGLGDCRLPDPTMPLQSQHAVSYLIETLMNSSQKITLALSGSLTNIACAFIMEPRIKEKIEKMVVMGGVMGLGNVTPAAEYNFYCDPHATHVVFSSGVPIVMIGLDVTRNTQTSVSWLHTIREMQTPVSQAIIDMLDYYHRPDAFYESGVSGGLLHDPNIIAYLLNPELYTGRHAYVEIDVSPTILWGRSTVDWFNKSGFQPNAFVINSVNVEGFFDLLTSRLRRYPSDSNEVYACNHC